MVLEFKIVVVGVRVFVLVLVGGSLIRSITFIIYVFVSFVFYSYY